jgi:hypothetical protein
MWSMTLTVEVDGEPRVFSPELCLFGPDSFTGGALRLELVDEHGAVRHAERRELTHSALGTDISLRAFETPDGAEPEDVLGWCWQIAVEAADIELIRWRRYLAASNRLTVEAEIEIAGPAAGLRPKIEDEGFGPEAPWDPRDSERLLAALAEEGIIGPDDRDEILFQRVTTGKTVERILIDRGVLGEREVLIRYAEVSGSEFVELTDYPIDPDAAATIPDEMARRHGAIGIGFRGELLTVAMSDPQREPWEVADLYARTGTPIYIVVATRADVLAALDRRHLISERLAR